MKEMYLLVIGPVLALRKSTFSRDQFRFLDKNLGKIIRVERKSVDI